MGFSANFPRKIRKLDFLELFLNGKIYGLGPRGCGPCRPSPSWTSGHCLMPELIGARPPAALVAGVAGRGADEGKGSMGVPVLGSPGIRRRRSGGVSVVKAVVGRVPVQVAQGSEMGQGGAGEEWWEEGMPGRPFIGSEWEQGAQASEGNGRWRWCTVMVVEATVSGGD
jgi:hypothetical protein